MMTDFYLTTQGKIAEALGLSKCRWLRLTLEAGKLMIVEAEYLPEVDGVMKLEPILKKFELVEKEDEKS